MTNSVGDMWALTSSQRHTGNYSWGFRDPASGYLPGGVDSSLWTKPIDLTNARDATLSAFFKFNINSTAGRPPDGFRVEISNDTGVSWKALSLGARCAKVSPRVPVPGVTRRMHVRPESPDCILISLDGGPVAGKLCMGSGH